MRELVHKNFQSFGLFRSNGSWQDLCKLLVAVNEFSNVVDFQIVVAVNELLNVVDSNCSHKLKYWKRVNKLGDGSRRAYIFWQP